LGLTVCRLRGHTIIKDDKLMLPLFLAAAMVAISLAAPCSASEITDVLARTVKVPDKVERVICSGPGCLRLLTYLRAQDLIVGVDEIEKRGGSADARAYALANPQFKDLPMFGQHRGRDNPELILSLKPAPQVILKTLSAIGPSPQDVAERTGIPTVAMEFGDLGPNRASFDQALRIMGQVTGRQARAEEVIAFIDSQIMELKNRTARSTAKAPPVFVGGVAFQGAQGFSSTEPNYPPFALLGLTNLASNGAPANATHSIIAKEQIVAWDPAIIFLDLATLQEGTLAGGLYELRTDPAYRALTAVTKGNVWGVLPYNIYTKEVGSILADAWFIGTLTRPDSFGDVDPVVKANEIEEFLVGKPVFKEMNALFDGNAFQRVPLR
jgi:iron complex transport system substrate-binding protein